MKELLEFIIKNILGEGVKFEVLEEDDGNLVKLTVKTPPDAGGLIIGKQGKIIKAIKNILKIKAVLLKRKLILEVNPS